MATPGRAAPLGARHPAVVAAARLHRSRHRREEGSTLIEGPNLLAEALAASVVPTRVFATPEDEVTQGVAADRGLDLSVVDERALARLAGTKTPRGPVAVVKIPEPRLDPDRSLLVAHGVSEPGNLGALIRTAAAFGWGFAVTPGSADPWSPKALRSGAGGHFRASVGRVETVEELVDWATVATVADGGERPDSLSGGPWAVLVGEEAAGLPAEVVSACRHRVTIPMPGGTESLNAGVAAGIVVYELSR
jgi:RNA methyltransferase, TrmH family